MYHQVAELPPDRDPLGLSVSPRDFRRQMAYLAQGGYRCLSLGEAVENLARKHRPRKTFVLTFDDGFEDFYTTAWPILDEYGFTATVFQVVGRIGQDTDWEGQSGPRAGRLMTWAQLRELTERGITIGSHTMTHPRLTTLDADTARDELARSKQELEAQLGRAVDYFSYPYSAQSPAIQQIVAGLCYRAACANDRGAWDRFNVWRMQCWRDDSHLSFVLKAGGWYDRVTWLREQTILGMALKRIVRGVRGLRQPQTERLQAGENHDKT